MITGGTKLTRRSERNSLRQEVVLTLHLVKTHVDDAASSDV